MPDDAKLNTELVRLPAEEQEALDALLVALWQCRTERSFEHMRAKVEAAVAQIAVTRERRAAYFAMWQFFLRLPSPTPMSPEGGTGFSWSEVKSDDGPESIARCEHCGLDITRSSFTAMGLYDPDVDPGNDPVIWRHKNGYAACDNFRDFAIPKKGSDWEDRDEYLRMMAHPRALAGFEADFNAMQKADTFVMVLPCGKSAHLELGWAIGAGKRTAILLENPVEPELMYHCADYLARNVMDLLGWLGVED